MTGVFVTGTEAGVGKTLVAAALALALRDRGLSVGVCKPVQTGARLDDAAGGAARLRRWTGAADAPEEICPHAFAAGGLPLAAARLERVAVDENALLDHVRRLAGRHDVLVVAGVGGLLAPVGEHWTIGELAARTGFATIVVAPPGAAAVNQVLLTAIAARRLGLEVVGAVLNGDAEDAGEAELIESFGSVPVLGRAPWLRDEPAADTLLALAQDHLDVARLERVVRERQALPV